MERGVIDFTTSKPTWMFYTKYFNEENVKIFEFNTTKELKIEFAEEFL